MDRAPTTRTFPCDTAPRYPLRDRDRIFGEEFVRQVKAMGIKQVVSTPDAPRQRAYMERLIGTIRRECLDHVIVFNESGLRLHLRAFTDCYHRSRTHLSLEKDTPDKRPIKPASAGKLVAIAEVGVDCIIATSAAPLKGVPRMPKGSFFERFVEQRIGFSHDPRPGLLAELPKPERAVVGQFKIQ